MKLWEAGGIKPLCFPARGLVLKRILRPFPSFFDICVGGFLVIPCLRDDWNKGTFIIFYSAFLVLLGFATKPKREYKSLPLILLAIWSLINVFIHSYEAATKSITFKYHNFGTMAEGFLYIFLGAMLIITIVRHSTNLRYIFFLVPISICSWYFGLVKMGSSTPFAALGVAIVVYLFLSKRFLWGSLATVMGTVVAILHWPWLCMKWACRPLVWGQMATNIIHRQVRYVDGEIIDPGIQLAPYLQKIFDGNQRLLEIKPWLASIFGSGFENSIYNKYMWVDKDKYGWIYMQNDILHLAQCLGPIALILMAWFLIDSFKKIGSSIFLIPFLTVFLICSFQLTMWQPGKAGVYLIIGIAALTEGLRRREI